MHDRAQTWADDPAAYAGSLGTREPISLVPGLNFDDGAPPAGAGAVLRQFVRLTRRLELA